MKIAGKRVLALLLAVLMICSMLPISAAAVTADEAQHSVTVYFTLSEDGWFVNGNDDAATTLARVPVTVDYFDLADYGLEEYYRYESDSFENGGQYISDSIVEQPTVLHLLIKVLEDYFLADGSKLEVGGDALTVSGAATSLYMTSFWGHDANLMYFVDHAYPLMAPGWGATSDYILLEDGMEIDVAMFSDWGFFMDGAFACLDPDEAQIEPGEEVSFQTGAVSTSAGMSGTVSDPEPMPGLATMIFDGEWNYLDDLTDEAADDGAFSYTFAEEGTYHVVGVDPNMGTSDAKIAPAAATITVGKGGGSGGISEPNALDSLSIKDSAQREVSLSPEFSADTFAYSVTVSPYETELTVNAAAVSGKSTVRVNGASSEDGSFAVPLSGDTASIRITVSSADSAETAYTVAVNRIPIVAVPVNVTPSDATVFLTDEGGSRVFASEDGTYALLEGGTYHYVVCRNGYVAVSGSKTVDTAGLSVTLEKAAENEEILTGLPSEWPNFRGSSDNNGVVSSPTPKSADEATLYWASKIGDGYGRDAIGSPILVDGSLIFCSGTRLYKMDCFTGEILASGEMAEKSNFNIIPPTYAEGLIFVGLAGGIVQAFNADTLKPVWIYQDVLGGQPNSPLTYRDGCIYTGFWNSEIDTANFVCLSITDEDPKNTQEQKSASWTYSQQGGFYWAGAYAAENYVLVGTDDGNRGYLSDTSCLLSLDPKTGRLLDKIDGLNGDIRSSVVYDSVTGRSCFTSKGGSFYSVALDPDSGCFLKDENGVQGYDLKEILLSNGSDNPNTPAMSTSSPVIHNGRAYIGVSGASQFTMYSGHNITVLDLKNWEIAYQVPTKGYPQVSGLLSTAYEDKDGYAYIYFIDNYTPGQVRVIKDKPGTASVVDGVTETYTSRGQTCVAEDCAPVLFTPSGAQAQYAICSPIADSDGTLYFKNDSASMMALGSKINSLEVTQAPDKTVYTEGEAFDASGMKVTAYLANGLSRDVTGLVTFSADGLTTDDTDVTIYYPHVLYGDLFDAEKGNQAGVEAEVPETYVDLTVLSADHAAALQKVIGLIDAIGEVTLDSEQAIEAARKAYNALDETLKPEVSNYALLCAAEEKLAELKQPSGTPDDSSSEEHESSGVPDSSSPSESGTDSSTATPSTGESGAAAYGMPAFAASLALMLLAVRKKRKAS